MILKAIFLAIILYYALKTTLRLVGAMRRDGGRLGGTNPAPSPPGTEWQNSASTQSTVGADIEDAKFVDL